MIQLRRHTGKRLSTVLTRSKVHEHIASRNSESILIHLNVSEDNPKYMYYIGMSLADATALRDKIDELLAQ